MSGAVFAQFACQGWPINLGLNMKVGFLNDGDSIEWLKETHLKGVPLPANYASFKSFVIQGNEDTPHAVNLYRDENPHYLASYYRVRFVNESGAYAEACEYYGYNDTPVGGLAPIK